MKTVLAALLAIFLPCSGINGAIILTEIMYNPPESGTDTDEYLEIFNSGDSAVDLTNHYFSAGVTYTFGTASIAPSERILVAVNPAELTSETIDSFTGGQLYDIPSGTQIFQFAGSLSNSGETVTFRDGADNVLFTVTYDDVSPWPEGFAEGQPDGGGASIELIDLTAPDLYAPGNWQAVNGGSPGAAPIPEPTAFYLMGLGAIAALFVRRRA